MNIINNTSYLALQYWLNLSPFVGSNISCNDTHQSALHKKLLQHLLFSFMQTEFILWFNFNRKHQEPSGGTSERELMKFSPSEEFH